MGAFGKQSKKKPNKKNELVLKKNELVPVSKKKAKQGKKKRVSLREKLKSVGWIMEIGRAHV